MQKWVQVWKKRTASHRWEKLAASHSGITPLFTWGVPELNRIGEGGRGKGRSSASSAVPLFALIQWILLGSWVLPAGAGSRVKKGTGSLLSSSSSVLYMSSSFSLLQMSPGGRCLCSIPFTFSLGLLMPCCRIAYRQKFHSPLACLATGKITRVTTF